MKKKLKFTDSTLRDAHQSLWATRMHTEDMIPIADKLDNAGYYSVEVWGGATFDVCLRYLQEDPWERLGLLKRYIKKTPLQMLLRGQNLVGYQHYADDVVDAFVDRAADNGIDIFRIFDALNDTRNIEASMKAVKRVGKHAQATVAYTMSPVHTREHYLETARKLEDMGADSICIKDMAGLLMPFEAYELIRLLKKNIKVPLHLHSHYVGGMAMVTYLKAIEAGIDGLDTACVALAFGSSQPPIETIVRFLHDSDYKTDFFISDLFEISRYFDQVRKKYGYDRAVTTMNDMRVFDHQVPGGMISNLVRQLEQQNAINRLHEVLEEIPKVRSDMGYPPLVTPTSQIVGSQAVLNVLMGQRYKMVPSEMKAYVQGYYGRPPAPIKAEIKEFILGDEKSIDCRPADLIPPGMEKAREEVKDITQNEEDIISYALFGHVALKFFETRMKKAHERELERLVSQDELKSKSAQNPVAAKDSTVLETTEKENVGDMNVKEINDLLKLIKEANIDEFNLESDGIKLNIKKHGDKVSFSKEEIHLLEKAAVQPAHAHQKEIIEEKQEENVHVDKLVQVTSPMVGTFYNSPSPDAAAFVSEGELVIKGQTLCIIEAMNLMNEISAETGGKIVSVLVKNGEAVEYGQPLFIIEKMQ